MDSVNACTASQGKNRDGHFTEHHSGRNGVLESKSVPPPPCPPKRLQISVIRNFSKTVEIDHHKTVLPPVPSQGRPVSKGKTPVFSIPYKNVKVLMSEEASRAATKVKSIDLITLQEKLIDKKNGNPFTLKANIDDKCRISYSLNIPSALWVQLCKTVSKPSIHVQLGITGITNSFNGFPEEWTLYEMEVPFLPDVMAGIEFISDIEIPLKLVLDSSRGYCRTGLCTRHIHNATNLVFTCSIWVQFDDTEIFKDFGIEDSTLGIQEVSENIKIEARDGSVLCPRMCLMAQSEPFCAMMSCGMKEFNEGVINIPYCSMEAIKLIVDFLQGKQIKDEQLSPGLAFELFQFSDKYLVESLNQAMINFHATKSTEWFTPDDIINFYFWVENTRSDLLKQHAVTTLAKFSTETLIRCECFQSLPQKEAMALLLKLV